MVSTGMIASLALAGAACINHVEGHVYLTQPLAEFKKGASKSSWVAEFQPPWSGTFKTGAQYAAVAPSKGYKDLKSFLDDKGPSCGNSLPNAKAKPIPSDGTIKLASTIEHAGPCEVWLDNVRAFHNDDCEKAFGSATSFKMNFSACKGSCMLRFYWLGLQDGGKRWQSYNVLVRRRRALAHLELAKEIRVQRFLRPRHDHTREAAQLVIEQREIEHLHFVELLEIDTAHLTGKRRAIEKRHEEAVLTRHEAAAESAQRVIGQIRHLAAECGRQIKNRHALRRELLSVQAHDFARLRLSARRVELRATRTQDDVLFVREPADEATQVVVGLSEVQVRHRRKVPQVHARHEARIRVQLLRRRHFSAHVRDQLALHASTEANELWVRGREVERVGGRERLKVHAHEETRVAHGKLAQVGRLLIQRKRSKKRHQLEECIGSYI
ncbi:hypothetical protein FI667_g9833, partial [Globisporangium splendens]